MWGRVGGIGERKKMEKTMSDRSRMKKAQRDTRPGRETRRVVVGIYGNYQFSITTK